VCIEGHPEVKQAILDYFELGYARMRRVPLRLAVWLFPLLLLPLMLAASHDFGATWDEELQQRRGEQILDYYTGYAPELAGSEDGSHLYGAGFDVLAVGLQRVFRGDIYIVRHRLNAFVGWLGVVFCGLIAWRLFGPGTALLAMILLTVTPRYFGHSMNNPKDIPFATLSAAILYVVCGLPGQYPFFRVSNASVLALVSAMALNVRPGALLFLVYVAVLVVHRLQKHGDLHFRPAVVTAAWMAGITLATLAAGSLFWPWALERPLVGPISALREASSFGWPGYMLYDGHDVLAHRTPWHYVPRWMLYTTPLVTLIGVTLSVSLLRATSRSQGATVALWAVVLFPIVYVVGVHAVMYDGIRHLLFVYPPLAVLAAAGWMTAIRARSAAQRAAAWVVLVPVLFAPVAFIVREHPNQVVYFNEIAGGPAALYGRYEMDYWGNCLLQALGQADSLAPLGANPVKVSGWPLHLIRADASRYPRIEITERGAAQHSMEIVLSRGSRAAVTALASRPDLLAAVMTTDGALLCAVLPGPAEPRAR
jgi:hypothetical protein